jgi:hypothetical protein
LSRSQPNLKLGQLSKAQNLKMKENVGAGSPATHAATRSNKKKIFAKIIAFLKLLIVI